MATCIYIVISRWGDENILFTLIMTFCLFIIYQIFYYFEDENEDKNKEN